MNTQGEKMMGKGLMLLCSGLLATMFAVASTGVTGQTFAVYFAIFCGFYGLIATPIGLIAVIIASVKMSAERRR